MKQREAGKKRPVKKVSPGYLERSALYYLERYASSSGNLRRRLLLKATRSAETHGTDLDEAVLWIDALIAKLIRMGVLDDAKFAAMKVVSLHRQGKPQRIIAQTLSAKGLERADIDHAIGQFESERPNSELAAAITFARKRKFGPWRMESPTPEPAKKELASLARRGFALDIARKVLTLSSAAAAEALLDQD